MFDSGWIMRAFIEERLKDNFETALDFFTSALDLLQWGREQWKDVSFEEKGEVFRPAFIRGVKSLHLEALLSVPAFSFTHTLPNTKRTVRRRTTKTLPNFHSGKFLSVQMNSWQNSRTPQTIQETWKTSVPSCPTFGTLVVKHTRKPVSVN